MTKVVHVGITVSDLERAVRFYREGLGFEVTARQVSDAPYLGMTGYPGVKIAAAFVKLPGDSVFLEIQQYSRVPAEPPREPGTARAGSSHLCLVVDDFDSALERALAFGGTSVGDPITIDRGINKGGRGIYLRDPDGYTVELFQRGPQGGIDRA